MLVTINAARRLGVRTIGALSYGLSPVHTDELYVRTARDLIKRGKVDAIWLKDAGGLLTVDRIRTLVPAIKKVIGDVPLELHSHCHWRGAARVHRGRASRRGVHPHVYRTARQRSGTAVHAIDVKKSAWARIS